MKYWVYRENSTYQYREGEEETGHMDLIKYLYKKGKKNEIWIWNLQA